MKPFLSNIEAEEITPGCQGGVIGRASLSRAPEKKFCATRTGWASQQL